MNELPFHRVNPWILYPFVMAIVLSAQLLGDALGRVARRRNERAGRESAFEMVTTRGALLGLLSLMIGFTFSLTLTNFQAHRQAVVNIATTISTLRDRISVLPPTQSAAAGRLLDAFIDAQIAMGTSSTRKEEQAATRSVALRDALLRVANSNLSSGTVGAVSFQESVVLLGQRLRERLDIEINEVPPAIFLTLYTLNLASWSFISYATALEGQNSRVVNGMMAAIFGAVVALVADVDRPYAGLVTPDQQPLLMLRASPSRVGVQVPPAAPSS